MIYFIGSNDTWSGGPDLYTAMAKMKEIGEIDRSTRFVVCICHPETIVTEEGDFQHPKDFPPVNLGLLDFKFKPIPAVEEKPRIISRDGEIIVP